MRTILAFAMIALCSVATATNPRSFRSSRDFCPQGRNFGNQQRDFRDFSQPRTIITETEIRRGLFGRVRSQSTTRTVR